jgi:small-conductance mechanosensitive channel
MEQLQDFYTGLSPRIQNLLFIIAAILAGLLIKGLIFSLIRISFKKSREYMIVHSILDRTSAVLNFLFPLLALAIILPFLYPTTAVQLYLDKTLQVLLIIGFSWLAIMLILVGQDYVNAAFDIEKEDNFRARKIRTQVQFMKKLLILGIIIFTISVLLFSFERMRTIGAGLLTSAGVTGIIIGFAAQRSIANLIAGFQIAFTQPIRIDDVVVLEGEFGRIEEINLTYVVLRLWDQRRLIVPINYFIEKPFQNWTRQSSEILGTVFLYTDYGIPLEEVRAELRRLCEESSYWNKKVCALQVTDTTEHSMQLRVLISAANSGHAFELRVLLREKLLEFIRNNYPESLPRTRATLTEERKQGPGSPPLQGITFGS